MEFVRDFSFDDLELIVEKALAEGYKILLTEWLDEWEREEGCPSICYELDYEDIYTEYGDLNVPEETKYGCAEWNFVKDDEYIFGYHIERGDEYICLEAFIEFLGYNPLLKEFDFTTNTNPFELVYHAKKRKDNYKVTWKLDGKVLSKDYTRNELFEKLNDGTFKQLNS